MANKTCILLALLLLAPPVIRAQTALPFPGETANITALRAQEKAEELFQQGQYDQAYFIYRNELAPIGDKYSQYMVGFMLLTGNGVASDRAEAAAWYRLAAERGTQQFIAVRDRLVASLEPDLKLLSDRLYIDLRKKYGDLAIIMRAARRDYETLRRRAGTRMAGDALPMTLISGSNTSAADHYGRIEKRMRQRLEYIAGQTRVEIEQFDPESIDIIAIERSVARHLDELGE